MCHSCPVHCSSKFKDQGDKDMLYSGLFEYYNTRVPTAKCTNYRTNEAKKKAEI